MRHFPQVGTYVRVQTPSSEAKVSGWVSRHISKPKPVVALRGGKTVNYNISVLDRIEVTTKSAKVSTDAKSWVWHVDDEIWECLL